jgi:hypothetical protein
MAEQKAALLALEDLGVFDQSEVDEALDEIHTSDASDE